MIKGVIFDLDQTLVDSSALEKARSMRDWKYTYTNLHLTDLFNGIKEVLEFLNSKNIKIAIVTNSPRPYAEKMLQHHCIKYDVLIHYHSVSRRKPDSEPMLKALQELELNCEDVISLGDHEYDITAAAHCGIPTILCSWGNPFPQNCSPDTIVSSPNDLKELLNKLEFV